MEIFLGDKIWFYYGVSSLVVGHVIDHSPKFNYFAISPVPYDDYQKGNLIERAQMPLSWFDIKGCSIEDRIPYDELKKISVGLEKSAGFNPILR